MKRFSNTLIRSQIELTKPRIDVWIQDPFLKNLYEPVFNSEPIDWHWEIAPKNWKSLLKKQKPQHLIFDLSVVSEKPIQAIQEIKSLSPSTEIIVLSNTDEVQTAISAFKSGIADYYLKPTNPETLLYAVKKLCSQKELTPVDPILQTDLQIFTVTHHINIAESDSKMRALAVTHLISLLDAGGAVWLRPLENDKKEESSLCQSLDGKTFAIEYWGVQSSQEAQSALEKFQSAFPFLIRDSFYNQLTSHPEHWFRGNCAWIPLKHSHMGGILLFDIAPNISPGTVARTEFLVRSLEVSLENHQRYIEAKRLTYIDDLTGLYNPRFLDRALTIAISSLQKEDEGFCVLFIDIDKFKSVNDQHGHVIGSQILSHLGKGLKSSLRKSDHVFRYGGDEFIAVLYGTSLPKAQEIAERIRKTTENRTFKFPNTEIKITLSIGIARFPDHGQSKEVIISMADNAMYASKKKGRNQVIVAEPVANA